MISLVGLVAAKPTADGYAPIYGYYTNPLAVASNQFHAQDEIGQYNYGYSNQVSISLTFYEQLFCMKVFSAAFLCLQYGFVIYGQMEIDKKAACKMLLSILYFTVANKKEPFTIVKNIKLPPKTLF